MLFVLCNAAQRAGGKYLLQKRKVDLKCNAPRMTVYFPETKFYKMNLSLCLVVLEEKKMMNVPSRAHIFFFF